MASDYNGSLFVPASISVSLIFHLFYSFILTNTSICNSIYPLVMNNLDCFPETRNWALFVCCKNKRIGVHWNNDIDRFSDATWTGWILYDDNTSNYFILEEMVYKKWVSQRKLIHVHVIFADEIETHATSTFANHTKELCRSPTEFDDFYANFHIENYENREPK